MLRSFDDLAHFAKEDTETQEDDWLLKKFN